jgi:hypothetical protein
MRKMIAASVVLLLAAACSTGAGTSSTNASNAKIVLPAIQLVQTSSVPVAARHTDGGLTIQYAMRVENRAAEPITLRRVTVQSISDGAYYVAPTSKPYDLAIEPAQKEDVEFFVAAQPGGTITGANGPVTMRVTCQFDSPSGKFQHIVMQTVNDRTAISGLK